jgi:ectoine hydroxylase-related dioxygenase (phytanoyl-CoA dioxygenase family)
MNKQQIAEYNNNGFCIIRGLLPVVDSKNILTDIHSLVRFQLKRFEPNLDDEKLGNEKILANEMGRLLQFDVSAYLAFARMSAKLVKLHRYLSHNNILSVLSNLNFELPTIVTEPVLHISSDKLIIPNGYVGFDTHQDWPSIQGSLDCVVVWVPLVDVSSINFPLQVIPGSHKKGLYKGEISENLLRIDPKEYNFKKHTSIEAKAGDVVIMSSWTLHQTGVRNSTGFRLACSTRYDNSAEQTFIERDYPCAYQRSVKRELITPDFPSKNQVSKLFE